MEFLGQFLSKKIKKTYFFYEKTFNNIIHLRLKVIYSKIFCIKWISKDIKIFSFYSQTSV